jgi:hypothetical protein
VRTRSAFRARTVVPLGALGNDSLNGNVSHILAVTTKNNQRKFIARKFGRFVGTNFDVSLKLDPQLTQERSRQESRSK